MVTLTKTRDLRTPVNFWGPVVKTKRPGFRHVILGFILAVAIFPLIPAGTFILTHMDTLDGPDLMTALTEFTSGTGLGLVANTILLWAGLLTGVAVAAKVNPGGFKELVSWRINRWDPLIAVGFLIFGFGVSQGLPWVWEHLYAPLPEGLGNTGTFTKIDGPWRIAVIAAVCVGGPIVEEIFFRGLVFRAFQKNFSTVSAVIGSSLLFGLMHVQPTLDSSVYMVISAGLLGVGLALIRLKTGRLGTAILAHILFNSINLMLALVFHLG